MDDLSSTTRRADKLESDCGTLYFQEPGVEMTLSTADGALLLIPELNLHIWTSAKETTLRIAVLLLRAETASYVRTLTHELSDDERKRKGLLLGLIDISRSGIVDLPETLWFAGWVTQDGEVALFSPMGENSGLRHYFGFDSLTVPDAILAQLVRQGWAPDTANGNFCMIEARVTTDPPTIIKVEYSTLKFPESE